MTSHEEDVLCRLPEFLTWTSGSPLLRESCVTHLGWIASRLRHWCDMDAAFRTTLQLLPVDSRKRLLLAPATFRLLLTSSPSQDMALLRGFADLEAYLCGQTTTRPARGWTALGDYYSGDADGADPGIAVPQLDSRAEFTASRLAGIIIDAYSPHDTSTAPESLKLGPYTRHAPQDVPKAMERISQGLALIQSVSPGTATMIHNTIQVISLRRVEGTTRTSSSSWRVHLGMVGLINADTEAWSAARMAEALIHEAIHNTIYKLELGNELFADMKRASSLTATSPWSGRTLKLTSFVHACFVWFGLWNFWHLCVARSEPDICELKNKAFRGFAGGSPLGLLNGEAQACISDAGRYAMTKLHDDLMKAA